MTVTQFNGKVTTAWCFVDCPNHLHKLVGYPVCNGVVNCVSFHLINICSHMDKHFRKQNKGSKQFTLCFKLWLFCLLLIVCRVLSLTYSCRYPFNQNREAGGPVNNVNNEGLNNSRHSKNAISFSTSPTGACLRGKEIKMTLKTHHSN